MVELVNIKITSTIANTNIDTTTAASPSDNPPIVTKLLNIIKPRVQIPDLNIDYMPYGKPVDNYDNILKGILIIFMFFYYFGVYSVIKRIFK